MVAYGIITRQCTGLCLDQQFYMNRVCRADSTEFELRTQALIVTCVLYCMAQIYTDHSKQAMLVKHVQGGRGGAWRKDRERVGKSERRVCIISTIPTLLPSF